MKITINTYIWPAAASKYIMLPLTLLKTKHDKGIDVCDFCTLYYPWDGPSGHKLFWNLKKTKA